MNRLICNLDALHHNLATINSWMSAHGADWLVVTKVLCGYSEAIEALAALGVRHFGESRVENLAPLKASVPAGSETWYLRIPAPSSIKDVVGYCDASLNSEFEVIRRLNEEAARQDKIHRVVIMIELGDLREGILPGTLMEFYQSVFEFKHIEVIGIGSNLGCLAGAMPSIDQFMQLVLYRELLELKFQKSLPFLSAGTSVALPLLLAGQLPRKVNHFRIGEALFLGTDLIHGGTIPGLRNDTFVLEAEVAELKEKALVPSGEILASQPFHTDSTSMEPNGDEVSPGQRGFRALISIGNLDTEVAGLIPEQPNHHIAGSSSDVTVVNVGEDPGPLTVGGLLRFRLSYASLLRLMSNQYVAKELRPSLDIFRDRVGQGQPAING